MYTFNYGVFSSQYKEPFVFKIFSPGRQSTSVPFTIPINEDYAYNYNVHYLEVAAPGDPPISDPDSGYLVNQTGDCTIPFGNDKGQAGDYYQITITGLFPSIYFRRDGASAEQLVDIIKWGDNIWQTFYRSFGTCINLGTYTATDVPNLSEVTDCFSMFAGCSLFNSNLDNWDVSNITNMSSMFSGCDLFDSDLRDWDTKNVVNMEGMFDAALAFNGRIGDWNVSSVTNMNFMFKDALAFNQDLSQWCVTNIASPGPTDFDLGASNWGSSRPVWGTCP